MRSESTQVLRAARARRSVHWTRRVRVLEIGSARTRVRCAARRSRGAIWSFSFAMRAPTLRTWAGARICRKLAEVRRDRPGFGSGNPDPGSWNLDSHGFQGCVAESISSALSSSCALALAAALSLVERFAHAGHEGHRTRLWRVLAHEAHQVAFGRRATADQAGVA